MKKVIVSTLVLSLIVLGFGAFAVEAQMGNKMGGAGNRIDNNIERPAFQQNAQSEVEVLDLDEEQAEKVAELKEKHFAQKDQFVEKLQSTQRELREEVLKNESQEKITALETEVEKLRAQIDQARTDYLKEIKEVLTEEQLQKIAENEYRMGLAAGNGNKIASSNTYNKYGRNQVDSSQRGQGRGRHSAGRRGGYNNITQNQ